MTALSWAPRLPDHWEIVPLNFVAKMGTGHTPDRSKPEYWENCSIPWITLTDASENSQSLAPLTETFQQISEIGLRNSAAVLHPAGTVVLSRTASVGHSVITGDSMTTTQDFATWTCSSRVDARYLLLVFRSMRPEWDRLAFGSTHRTIYMPDLESLRIPLPPIVEQHRIVDYVADQVARIDNIVELRSKQLELVGELGLAREFRAIGGFDEPGERRESGLRWLGSVPSSWETAAVSHRFEVELGKMLEPSRKRGEYLRPYLRVANVQWGSIDIDQLAEMDFPPTERGRYRLRVGDLLVCEGGSWPGRAAVWSGQVEEIYYQKALHRIRPAGRDLVRWLYYCLKVAEGLKVFLAQGNSNTITHLTREQLRPQRFPFPDVETQDKIVRKLDARADHDLLVRATLARQIRCLAERRQALITAAVTGQIDVSTARGVEI